MNKLEFKINNLDSALDSELYKHMINNNIKESWKEKFRTRCILPSNAFDIGYLIND